MKKFKSRIGLWFYLLLAACCALAILGAVLWSRSREGVLFCVMLFGCLDVLLLLPLLFMTDYTLTEKGLTVRCAYLVHEHIPYRCIKLVQDTRDFTFGPALSFDRIEIRYRIAGKDGRQLLSPKKKAEFIQQLTEKTASATATQEKE